MAKMYFALFRHNPSTRGVKMTIHSWNDDVEADVDIFGIEFVRQIGVTHTKKEDADNVKELVENWVLSRNSADCGEILKVDGFTIVCLGKDYRIQRAGKKIVTKTNWVNETLEGSRVSPAKTLEELKKAADEDADAPEDEPEEDEEY